MDLACKLKNIECSVFMDDLKYSCHAPKQVRRQQRLLASQKKRALTLLESPLHQDALSVETAPVAAPCAIFSEPESRVRRGRNI